MRITRLDPRWGALAFALLLSLLGTGVTWGQEPGRVAFDDLLKGWNQTIQHATKALENDFARVEVAEIKDDLQATLDSAREARSQAMERLESAKQQLQSVAPEPTPKASKEAVAAEEPKAAGPEVPTTPPATEEIVELRKEMRSRVAKFNAQVTQANLIISQANELLESIADWEQARNRAIFLKRSPPPLSLGIWQQAAANARAFAREAIEAPRTWWNTHDVEKGAWRLLAPLLAVLLLGLVIGWPTRLWLERHFGRDAAETEPTYAWRIVAAVADGFANAVIPAATVSLILLVLYLQGVLTGLFALLFYSGGVALAAYLMIMGIVRAAVSPHLVAWRIVPVQPAYAFRVLHAIRGISASLLITLAVLTPAYLSNMLTPELESAFFVIQITLTSLLLVWALAPGHWETTLAGSQRAGSVKEAAEHKEDEPTAGDETEAVIEEEPARRSWFDTSRKALRVIMLLTPFLALAGYGRLAFYIQSRVVAAASLIGFALLLRLAIGEMSERWLVRRRPMPAGAARKAEEADQRKIRGSLFWTGMAVDLAIFLPLIYVLLLLFGVPATTLHLWIDQLLSGIQIGTISISLGAILLAILVLIIGVVITNLIRHWLANRVLPNTRLDIGARNSIASGTGYLGVAIALLIAISTLGVDFSSLALVAGALSVGIGFGLQNVVQNFVAGLLMLIERPIKVGDWVVVGATEGTVKRIAVRATEIETFDRSSVFVPNSEFISSPVTNWTHQNRLARLIVPVRVAYGSDTKAVAAILLRCAKAHRSILRYPRPAAYFLAFGDFSLNFELRCYVNDTDYYLEAISELHFAIDEAFRQEGIKIPFPQRDLHLRTSGLAPSLEQQGAGEITTDERRSDKRG
ncbi:MAG: mechanosensitive ion channel [Nitrococcus sp.]|nr:mechanosensitive ion channel [Nitrococcus sp.]